MPNDKDLIARQVEKIVDIQHKTFPILSQPRATVILNILRVFEDSCRLGPMFAGELMHPEVLDTFVHNYLDYLDMAIRWAYECCPDTEVVNREENLYLDAGFLLREAGKYRAICDSYTLWSRGRHDIEVNRRKRTIKFHYLGSDGGHIDAADFVLRHRKKSSVIGSPEYLDNQINLIKIKEELSDSISDLGHRIDYSISPRVWDAFQGVSRLQIEHMCELPDNWNVTYFTLKEFKELWEVLLTRAQIHNMACLLSGKEGAALESVVLLFSFDQLCQEITSRSSLSLQKTKEIVNFLIYDPSIKNIDVIWQPIIKLDFLHLAVSPNLIMTNSAERNLISLINKIDQPSYSRVSNQKEDIMAQNILNVLSKEYLNLDIALKKALPDPLPDMDLVIYDMNTETLLVGEMKWLIPTDSIAEVCSRDEDIVKGISQAQLIWDYASNNLEDCLNRAFKNSKLKVQRVVCCVISKNNIGSSYIQRTFPVISEDSFLELFDKHNGNLSIISDEIEQGKYLPQIDIDYKLREKNVRYAGWKFIYPAIRLLQNADIT